MRRIPKSGLEGHDVRTKVTVTIADQEYHLVASEDAAYMEKVAKHVDVQVRDVLHSTTVSTTQAATLAALNIADEYFKEVDTSENLRAQLKKALEDAEDLNNQLSQAKREILKLQNQQNQQKKKEP